MDKTGGAGQRYSTGRWRREKNILRPENCMTWRRGWKFGMMDSSISLVSGNLARCQRLREAGRAAPDYCRPR